MSIIFIGRNGTGKTTFINLMQGVLRADLRVLMSLQFSRINLKLSQGSRHRTITVTKEPTPESPLDLITFKVSNRSYKLPISLRILEGLPTRPYQARYLRGHIPLQRAINALVNVSSLSVHRDADDLTTDEEFSPSSRRVQTPIDRRLQDLIDRLTRYQLQLSGEANKISQQFQKQVLVSILHDPALDTPDIRELSNVDLSSQEDDLLKAYRSLEALDPAVEIKIQQHVRELILSKQAVTAFIADPTKQDELGVERFLALPLLLRRTTNVIALSVEAAQRKQAIFQPLDNFIGLLKDFMLDKTIERSLNSELTLSRNDKDIAISDLSSGEKQLLILLTETLLQRNERFIFLADEPELSLHIEWQAKVISSIRGLNNNAQIIVATHSPEITGSWKQNVLDMQDIIHA
jgi:ABC-type lipoprotein export system ATPase subunit